MCPKCPDAPLGALPEAHRAVSAAGLGTQHMGAHATKGRSPARRAPARRWTTRPRGPPARAGARRSTGRRRGRPAPPPARRAGRRSLAPARRAATTAGDTASWRAAPPPRGGSSALVAFVSSHRTTERSARNGHDAVDAELGELLHHQLRPAALHQREPDRHRRRRRDSLDRTGDHRRAAEARRPPRPAPVADHQRVADRGRRSTRARWWRSSSATRGRVEVVDQHERPRQVGGVISHRD